MATVGVKRVNWICVGLGTSTAMIISL